MIPIVALVGRPNVGKSTLFNRLTRTRNALVSDFSGLTRDRQYGRATYGNQPFMVVDTGGIEGGETGIEALALKQTEQAIAEADCVVFIVDAKAGLCAADEMLAHKVRLSKKPVIVLANKMDKANADAATAEFHQLALGEPLGISAAHNRGINKFLEVLFTEKLEEKISEDETHSESESGVEARLSRTVARDVQTMDGREPKGMDAWPRATSSEGEHQDELSATSSETEIEIKTESNPNIKIAIIGKPNVGKSTLVNRMLGEERVIVYDMPGTTRDSIFVPMERHGKNYTLIDTAGIRRKSRTHETIEKFSIIKSLQAVDEANVVIIVIDAHENITDQDLHLLGYVLDSGRSLMIAINKWDGLDASAKNKIKEELTRKLTFINFAKIHYISALHGTGVGNLFDTIDRIYKSATKKHSTNQLTKILNQATHDHTPPTVNQRRIKLKFAHSGGHNPPIIVIHGNQAELLPKDYQRYLVNYFRDALKLEGTPIHLQLKTTENPFKGQKNELTEAQARSRQRIIVRAKKEKKRRQEKRKP